ncbi:MAG: hypothetical protein ACTSXT_01435 [Candidatus Helarchaeota archaeon]
MNTLINKSVINLTYNPILKGLDEDEDIINTGLVNYLGKGCGYCFNYALKDAFLEDCYETFEVLEKHYKRINFNEARKSDILTFHSWKDINGFTVNHFAIIEKTALNLSDWIISSKWGILGIYKGKLTDLPDIYGRYIAIWRKKN